MHSAPRLVAGAATTRARDNVPVSGWQLPPDAPDTKNPLTVNDKVLADGQEDLQPTNARSATARRDSAMDPTPIPITPRT